MDGILNFRDSSNSGWSGIFGHRWLASGCFCKVCQGWYLRNALAIHPPDLRGNVHLVELTYFILSANRKFVDFNTHRSGCFSELSWLRLALHLVSRTGQFWISNSRDLRWRYRICVAQLLEHDDHIHRTFTNRLSSHGPPQKLSQIRKIVLGSKKNLRSVFARIRSRSKTCCCPFQRFVICTDNDDVDTSEEGNKNGKDSDDLEVSPHPSSSLNLIY